jgi:PAS domain S-box-containing protein
LSRVHAKAPAGTQASDLDVLPDRGAVAALLRRCNWTASPLGPPEAWPSALRGIAGLMLASKFPMFLAWGPQLALLYNDAYAPILGSKHPHALGRPFREVWSEIWTEIEPLVERALAGEATFHENFRLVMERNGYPEETWYTFSYSPVPDDSGAVGGMFCACTETTQAVLTDRRQGFRLRLDDRLRGLTDAREVMYAAAELIGAHLGVARTGYGEIDPAGEIVSVERDWTSSGAVASLAGEARILDAFGPAVIADLRAGRTLVVEDCLTDPRSAGEAYAATWAGIGCRSLVVVPLLKEGRFRALFYLHEPAPRRWTASEAELARDVAERTWDAVERARAETELRDREERLRMLADNLPNGMVYQAIREPTGQVRFTYVSQAAERLHGLDPEAVVADAALLDAQVLEEFRPTLERVRREAGRTGRLFSLELPMRVPSGEVRWFQRVSAPRTLPSGQVVWDGVELDVTDRRRAEESNAHLAAIVASSGDAIISASLEGVIQAWNPAAEAIFGYSAAEAIGRPVWMLMPDGEARDPARYFARVRRGEILRFEGTRLRKDGTAFAAWITLAPMRSQSGAVVGFSAIASDVTERRRSEKQIRFQAHLLDSVEEAVVATDLDGRVVYWNGFAEKLYGWSPDEALGRNVLELTSASDPSKAEHTMALLRQGGRWSGEFTGRRRDGSTFPGQVSDAPVYEHGELVGIVGISYDITERKRWEEHQRLLLNELNHRVKNTLATVQSIASQSLRHASSFEGARTAIESRLVALSRAHDVLTRENWEAAGIHDIVAQAVQPFRSHGENRITFLGPAARVAPRTALALAMALQELATNAVKYGALSNDAGEVGIRWRVDRSSARATLHLTWEETGGPPVAAPTRQGFGTRLIERSLAQDLNGEVRIAFAPGGVTCTIAAPLLG